LADDGDDETALVRVWVSMRIAGGVIAIAAIGAMGYGLYE